MLLQPSELLNLTYYNEPISGINIAQMDKRPTFSSKMTMVDVIHNLSRRFSYMEKYAQAYTTQHVIITNIQHYNLVDYNHAFYEMHWLE